VLHLGRNLADHTGLLLKIETCGATSLFHEFVSRLFAGRAYDPVF